MSSETTERLADLIDKKQRCLSQLRELGQRQGVLIEADQMQPLLKLLAAKQHLIELLVQIERELDPYRGQDPEKRAWRSPADRARCREQSETCRQLLAEVFAQEKESERRMVARRDDAARQLQGTHSAQQARQAYQPASPQSGVVDLRSS